MSRKTLISSLLALAAAAILAIPGVAAARTGAIVFSQVTEDHRVYESEGVVLPPKAPEGGLFAVRGGHLNQLTENPADAEPSFSRDGRTIAFSRAGDVFAVRADGSGLRRLTSGSELDSRPQIAPNGRYVVFERAAFAGQPHDLHTVRTNGGPSHRLVGGSADEHEASFAPDGRSIAFVRGDDVFRVLPSGRKLRRLTRSGAIDEWAPLNLGGRVIFSRGVRAEDETAYADIYSVRADGRKLRQTIAGAGSSYVDDVTRNGRVLLFHRDQGLWLKKLGGRSRLLVPIDDGVEFSAVFASDGRKVALYRATEEEDSVAVVDVKSGGIGYPEARAFPTDPEVPSAIGPVIAWQPVR
jgi:tricorn protease-like protein